MHAKIVNLKVSAGLFIDVPLLFAVLIAPSLLTSIYFENDIFYLLD